MGLEWKVIVSDPNEKVQTLPRNRILTMLRPFTAGGTAYLIPLLFSIPLIMTLQPAD